MSSSDILSLISRSDKAFSEIEKGSKKNFSCLSQEVSHTGKFSNQLREDLRLLYKLKPMILNKYSSS
jgi:hypothetical protein